MRAPASGAKIKKAKYPDVVAIKKGRVAVFEVKSRSREGAVYIDREQVEKLLSFAERAGGKAYIAVRISGRGWVFVPASKLEYTGSTYRVSREAIGEGMTVEQLEADLGLVETLDRYFKKEQGSDA
jgi:Holliday junction resolvase